MENTTETKTEINQVKKFNDRIVKSKGKNPNSATIVKRFNFIDLTGAIKASIETKAKEPKPVKTRFRSTPTKERNWELPTITDLTTIDTMPGSISRFINECHPDVRTFIQKGGIDTVQAAAGQLIVKTKKGMRVVITVKGKYTRHIRITQRKNVLFDGNTTCKIEKEENKRKEEKEAA